MIGWPNSVKRALNTSIFVYHVQSAMLFAFNVLCQGCFVGNASTVFLGLCFCFCLFVCLLVWLVGCCWCFCFVLFCFVLFVFCLFFCFFENYILKLFQFKVHRKENMIKEILKRYVMLRFTNNSMIVGYVNNVDFETAQYGPNKRLN